MLFAEWYRICELPGANDPACAHYVLQLQQSGLLKGDDTSDRFFRLLTVMFLNFLTLLRSFRLTIKFNLYFYHFSQDLSVSHCLSSEVIGSGSSQPHQALPLSFLAIDIYAKLVYSILKVSIFSLKFGGKFSHILPQ